MRRRNKYLLILGIVIVLLVAIRLSIEPILLDYANDKLNALEAYDGHIDDLDLSLLRGGYDILRYIEKKLDIKAGETTPDGAFTVVEEECLAACANAPMMICGNDYFLDLTEKKVDAILDDLRRRYHERQKMETPGGVDPRRTLMGFGPGSKT